MLLIHWGTVVAMAASGVLVPPDGEAVHCGGQDPASFGRYSSFMGPKAAPAVSMTYVGLAKLNRTWFAKLNETLASQPTGFILPQIGLALPQGDELSKVGAGAYSAQIAELVAGLRVLARPAYIRVGYEFNGGWNNYPATDYKTAWAEIVAPIRADPALASTTAIVWDYSCDAGPAALNWTLWLPERRHAPDWWGVNIFSGASLAGSKCVANYVAAAAAAGMPVVLGESSPRTFGVLTAPWSHLQPLGSPGPQTMAQCLGVAGAAATDGSAAVLWSCGPAATSQPRPRSQLQQRRRRGGSGSDGGNQLWRLNSDRWVINKDGKCLGHQQGATGQPATALVVTECGGPDQRTAPPAIKWTHDPATGRLLADGGGCLVANGTTAGSPVVLTHTGCTGAAARWSFEATDVGGGAASWSGWFEPYLKLLADNPDTVKLFCYIDWFWPAFSNNEAFNWYNWGDARVELNQSGYVGGRWKAALSRPGIIHATNQDQLCAKLGC